MESGLLAGACWSWSPPDRASRAGLAANEFSPQRISGAIQSIWPTALAHEWFHYPGSNGQISSPYTDNSMALLKQLLCCFIQIQNWTGFFNKARIHRFLPGMISPGLNPILTQPPTNGTGGYGCHIFFNGCLGKLLARPAFPRFSMVIGIWASQCCDLWTLEGRKFFGSARSRQTFNERYLLPSPPPFFDNTHCAADFFGNVIIATIWTFMGQRQNTGTLNFHPGAIWHRLKCFNSLYCCSVSLTAYLGFDTAMLFLQIVVAKKLVFLRRRYALNHFFGALHRQISYCGNYSAQH